MENLTQKKIDKILSEFTRIHNETLRKFEVVETTEDILNAKYPDRLVYVCERISPMDFMLFIQHIHMRREIEKYEFRILEIPTFIDENTPDEISQRTFKGVQTIDEIINYIERLLKRNGKRMECGLFPMGIRIARVGNVLNISTILPQHQHDRSYSFTNVNGKLKHR